MALLDLMEPTYQRTKNLEKADPQPPNSVRQTAGGHPLSSLPPAVPISPGAAQLKMEILKQK